MKILVLHQYFNTPSSGGPLRSYYIASGLQASGFQVEVITAHNKPYSEVKEIEGFKVHYLPVYYENGLGFKGRIKAFVKFAWLAYRKARKLKDIDLCYAISTPLTVGWVAKRLKASTGIPYIFEVGDLWPEAPIQMGVLKSSWIINATFEMEKTIYQHAQEVVALSPGIKSSIIKRVPGTKVSVIPNMSDCQFYQMEAKNPLMESFLGVTGKFVVTYFGAAGKANHLEYYIEAAREAQTSTNSLHFLMVAQGSELVRIKQLAQDYQLENISFLSYRDRSELRKVLNVTDAVYVSYADVPVLTTGSPNKYFDGLAAGKLMIVNFEGWLKSITENHQLGFYVDPKDPQMLTNVLRPFIANPERLGSAQSNARVIAETFFSRSLSIQKLLRVLGHESNTLIKEPQVYTLTA